MDALGTTLLVVAAVGIACAAALGVVAERRPGMLRAARGALGAGSLLLVAALVCLAQAFLGHDFSLRYVADYSDRATSLAYLFAGVWAGQAGSLLLWTALLGVTAWLFLAARHRDGRAAPGDGWLTTFVALLVFAFLAIVILYSNPFQPMMRSHPLDGTGLNGLLRNPLMAVHPPVLFIGYALTVVPAVLAAAGLVRGDRDAGWVVEARPWALGAWAALGIGNVLGMLWAYEELGWGGYWGWDPVENASLLPWLASTAYLHAGAVSERRRMLLRTVAGLAFATMILPLFGTYLTRSGVIASQHAFGFSAAAPTFLAILGTLTAGSLALLAWRWRRLGKDVPRIESLLSREAGAVFTALLFAVIILAMTAATMAPLLGRVFGSGSVQIEPAGYVKFMGPLGLVLLFLTAVCPLLAYRRTTGRRLLGVFGVPGVAAVAVLAAHLVAGDAAGFGIRAGGRLHGFALVAFPLAAFVVVAALGDVVRGILGRTRGTSGGLPAAARWFVVSGRRRAGGDFVHLGAALVFAGFAGASYQQDAEGTLRPGGGAAAVLAVGEYRLTYLGIRDVETAEYQETQALVRVDTPDGASHLATPSLRRYRSGAVRDTAEVAILAGLVEDLYVEVRRFLGGSAPAVPAFLRAHVNPLTSLVWIGSVVLFAGTILAWWPVRRAGTAPAAPLALRRGRSYAVVVTLFAAVVAFLDSRAQAALVVAGGVLLAALWIGGRAVHDALAPAPAGKSDTPASPPGGERVDEEIAVERMMGRWGDP